MLRYPDGQREQIALSAKAKLMVSSSVGPSYTVRLLFGDGMMPSLIVI